MKKQFILFAAFMLIFAGCSSGVQDDTALVDPEVEEFDGKVFEIDAFSFGYSMEEIRVNQGDKVKIIMTNTGGSHDIVIDELGVKSAVISSGKTVEVEFVATEKGTFEYYCSVGSHRDRGMVGNLIVE